MQTLQCHEVEEILEEFLAGELDSDRDLMVRRHIKACQACHQEFAMVKDISVALKNLPEPQLPEDLYHSIASRYLRRRFWVWELLKSIKSVRSPFSGRQTVESRISYAVALLTVVATVTTFLFLYNFSPEPELRPVINPYKAYSSEEIERARQGLELALGQVQKAFDISSNAVYAELDKLFKPIKLKREGS